jgi:hypothetical protein
MVVVVVAIVVVVVVDVDVVVVVVDVVVDYYYYYCDSVCLVWSGSILQSTGNAAVTYVMQLSTSSRTVLYGEGYCTGPLYTAAPKLARGHHP